MRDLRLSTDRLELRLLVESDVDLLFPLHRDERVMKYIRPPDVSRDQTREYVQALIAYSAKHPGLGVFPAFRKTDRRFIGWGVLIHLEKNPEHEIEVGYRLHVDTWGQGYATEIGQALLRHARHNLKLERVVGITHLENFASQRVLIKLGLVYERDAVFYAHDVKLYATDLK